MRGWLVVAAMTFAGSVRADTVAERAAKLFEQGRDLVAHAEYQRAYDVFKQSYDLDRAVGTELNLADCLEHLNQPAKALALYEDAEKQLGATGKAPQAKFAHDRTVALAARVATIILEIQSQLPNTTVTIGGQPVATEPLIRQHVDPGSIEVVVDAPGATRFAKTITPAAGGTETMTVALAPIETPTTGRRDPKRVWIAIGIGSVGVITIATSAIIVGIAHSDYKATENDPTYCFAGFCNGVGLGKIERAQHVADVSTGVFIGGAALAVAAGVLWYTAPREHVTIAPTATPSSAGLTMSGAF